MRPDQGVMYKMASETTNPIACTSNHTGLLIHLNFRVCFMSNPGIWVRHTTRKHVVVDNARQRIECFFQHVYLFFPQSNRISLLIKTCIAFLKLSSIDSHRDVELNEN